MANGTLLKTGAALAAIVGLIWLGSDHGEVPPPAAELTAIPAADAAATAASDAATAGAQFPASAPASYAPSYSSAYVARRGTTDCTDDCSGHDAGYRWAENHDIDEEDDCDGNSESFDEGCRAYVEDEHPSEE